MNLKYRNFFSSLKRPRWLLAGVLILLFSVRLVAQPVVASGADFSAIVDDSGDLYVYGANSPEGPRLIEPTGVWESVAVSPTNFSSAHILAIRTDGSLWAWGE